MVKNQIICGESSEVMAGLPDDCVDLVVTSPPYDALRNYNGYVFPFEAIAQQLYRIIKPGGVVVWVVADQTIEGSETGISARQQLHFMGLGFNLHDTMIYHKNGVGACGSPNSYNQAWEYMFIFSKGKPKTFNPLLKPAKKAGQRVSYAKHRSNGDGYISEVVTKIAGGIQANQCVALQRWIQPKEHRQEKAPCYLSAATRNRSHPILEQSR